MPRQDFEIIGEITDVQMIATGRQIRERVRLNKQYGRGRWRKMKGAATIRVGGVGGGVKARKSVEEASGAGVDVDCESAGFGFLS